MHLLHRDETSKFAEQVGRVASQDGRIRCLVVYGGRLMFSWTCSAGYLSAGPQLAQLLCAQLPGMVHPPELDTLVHKR